MKKQKKKTAADYRAEHKIARLRRRIGELECALALSTERPRRTDPAPDAPATPASAAHNWGVPMSLSINGKKVGTVTGASFGERPFSPWPWPPATSKPDACASEKNGDRCDLEPGHVDKDQPWHGCEHGAAAGDVRREWRDDDAPPSRLDELAATVDIPAIAGEHEPEPFPVATPPAELELEPWTSYRARTATLSHGELVQACCEMALELERHRTDGSKGRRISELRMELEDAGDELRAVRKHARDDRAKLEELRCAIGPAGLAGLGMMRLELEAAKLLETENARLLDELERINNTRPAAAATRIELECRLEKAYQEIRRIVGMVETHPIESKAGLRRVADSLELLSNELERMLELEARAAELESARKTVDELENRINHEIPAYKLEAIERDKEIEHLRAELRLNRAKLAEDLERMLDARDAKRSPVTRLERVELAAELERVTNELERVTKEADGWRIAGQHAVSELGMRMAARMADAGVEVARARVNELEAKLEAEKRESLKIAGECKLVETELEELRRAFASAKERAAHLERELDHACRENTEAEIQRRIGS